MKSFLHSSIECLESRIAPASIIDVIAKGGVLTLKSLSTDDGDEKVEIRNAGALGEITIDPEPGTQLRFEGTVLPDGQAQTVTGITKSMSISLGLGADELEFANLWASLPVSVNLGAGDNKFNVSGLLGSLTYKGGNDGDIIDFTGTTSVSGKTNFDLGSGTNSVDLNNILAGGDVTFKGGAGSDTLTGSGGLVVGGKLSFQLGEGNNSFTGTNTFLVGRDFSITSGSGNDTITLNPHGNFDVGGNLTLNSGKGNDTLGILAEYVLHVGKNLSLISGGKILVTDDVDQDVSAKDGIHVGGKLSLTSGPVDVLDQSINALASNLVATGAVSLSGSAKDSNQSVFAGKAISIGGATSLTIKSLPGGATGFSQSIHTTLENGVSASVLQGAVTLTGGSDVTMTAAGAYHSAVKITTAKGIAASVELGLPTLNFEARYHGPLSIKVDPTAPNSTVSLDRIYANGAVSILGGGGGDTVTLRDIFAQGAVSVLTGAGADTVDVQDGSTTGLYSQYLDALTIKTGTEIDTIHLGGDSAGENIFCLGKVTWDTGPEADIAIRGTLAVILGDLKGPN